MIEQKVIHVFYHANCPDGIMAACVLEPTTRVKLEFHPLSYSDSDNKKVDKVLDSITEQSRTAEFYDVIFLDVVPYLDILEFYSTKLNILIIDHHLNNLDKITDANLHVDIISSHMVTFTKNMSGALLALCYTATFHNDLRYSINLTRAFINERSNDNYFNICNNVTTRLMRDTVPFYNLVKSISDYDSWTDPNIDNAKSFSGFGIFANMYKYDIELIRKQLIDHDAQDIINCFGEIHHLELQSLLKNTAYYPSSDNPTIAIVNASVKYASDLSLMVFSNKTKVLIVYQDNLDKHTRNISFRTEAGSKITALDLAKLVGGGGHENAAGARLSLNAKKSLLHYMFGENLDNLMELLVKKLI